MHRSFKGALAALASVISAQCFAADMPLKAPQSFLSYPYTGYGCYWGVNTEAGVQQTKADSALFTTSLVSGNLTAAGAGVGGTLGCVKGNDTNWIAVQTNLDWQNITGSVSNPVVGVSVSAASRWSASQVVKFGGFSSILSYLPNLGIPFPALPALPAIPSGLGIMPNTSHSYVMAGVQEFGVQRSLTVNSVGSVTNRTWAVAPLVGAGVLNQLVDTQGKLTGAVLDVYAKVVFGNKGGTVDFTNLGMPTLTGSSKAGTQYLAGLGIYY